MHNSDHKIPVISFTLFLLLLLSACTTAVIQPAEFPDIKSDEALNIVIRSAKDDTFNTNDYHYFKNVTKQLFENKAYAGEINFYKDGQSYDQSIPTLSISISKWYLYNDKFQCLLFASIKADGAKSSLGAFSGKDNDTLYNLVTDTRDGKDEAAYDALLTLYDKFITYVD